MYICACACEDGGGGHPILDLKRGEEENGEGRWEEKKRKIGEKGDSFKKNRRRDGIEPPLPPGLATTQY